MTDDYVAVELTGPLHKFLTDRGYTHIISLGIDDASDEAPESGKHCCWLEPLMPGDDRINDNDDDYIVEEINSSGVLDMVAGENAIQFMIKVPQLDMEDYLKKR